MLARPTLLALIALPAFAQTVYSWEDKDGVHYTDDPSLVPGKARTDATLLSPKPATRPATPADDSVQVVMDSPTSTQAQPQAQPTPAPQQPVVTQRQPPLVAEPTRDDRNEQEWRNRFITAVRRIETLEHTYAALERSRPQRMVCGGQTFSPVMTTNQIDPQTGAPVMAAGNTVYSNTSPMVVNGVPTVAPTTTVINGRPYVAVTNCAMNAEYDRITAEMEQTQVQLTDARKDLDQLDRDASRYAIPREWRRGW